MTESMIILYLMMEKLSKIKTQSLKGSIGCDPLNSLVQLEGIQRLNN